MDIKGDPMSILKTMLNHKIEKDIRYILFNAYLIITSVLGFVFAIIHAINHRPLINILTGLIIGVIALVMYWMTTRLQLYTLTRRFYLAFMTLVYIPFGHWSSPGSYSAVLYLEVLVIFIMTFVVVSKWEYIFPALGLGLSLVMLQTELWFPDNYPAYEDPAYRIFDISINYAVVVLALVFTIIYVINQYNGHNDMLYKLSITDPLTGLYNRRYINDFIEMEYNRSSRTQDPFSLVYIDLNNFKRINDSLGHSEGDKVLSDIAEIIIHNIRNYDLAARYGGDEFIIILPKTSYQEALKNMDRLNQAFNAYAVQYNHANFSVGFGVADSLDKTLDQMFKIADQALYERKNSQKSSDH